MKKVIFGVVVMALSAIAPINAVDEGTGTDMMDTFKTEHVDAVKDPQKVDSMTHEDEAVNPEIKVIDQHGNEVVPEVSE